MLEEWINGVERSNTDLVTTYGIYNDLHFYLKLNEQQRESLLDFLDSTDLELWYESVQQPNPYETDLVDSYAFGEKDFFQFLVKFPNKGIVFCRDSPLGKFQMLNEIDFRYDCSIQTSIFDNTKRSSEHVVNLVRSFILPQNIPSYVATVNSTIPKYQRFSYGIND